MRPSVQDPKPPATAAQLPRPAFPEPSSKKPRAPSLKEDTRYQQLRARVAAKAQDVCAQAELPERPIAAPLRGMEAIQAPPKYLNEVWFHANSRP